MSQIRKPGKADSVIADWEKFKKTIVQIFNNCKNNNSGEVRIYLHGLKGYHSMFLKI